MPSQAGAGARDERLVGRDPKVKTDPGAPAVLPFAHEQLLLSLQAAGHVPPSSQGLEASAENSKEEVAPGSSMAEARWALLQASSHLLKRARPEAETLGPLTPSRAPRWGQRSECN